MELSLVNYYGDLIKYIGFKNVKFNIKNIRKGKVMFCYVFHNQVSHEYD